MAVTLLTLIKAAPMKEETRQKFLAQLNQLMPAQKEKLSMTCWSTLSEIYFAKLKYEFDKMLLEIRKGEREYNKEDFEEVEKNLTKEFAQKLQSAETEESIEEVRSKLKKHLQKPVPKTE